MSTHKNRQVSDILVNGNSEINQTLSDDSVRILAKTQYFVVYRVENVQLDDNGNEINLKTGQGNKRYDLVVAKHNKVSMRLGEIINLFYDSLSSNTLPDEVSVDLDEINRIDRKLYYHSAPRAESCEKMLFEADDGFVYKNLLEKFPTPKSKL